MSNEANEVVDFASSYITHFTFQFVSGDIISSCTFHGTCALYIHVHVQCMCDGLSTYHYITFGQFSLGTCTCIYCV